MPTLGRHKPDMEWTVTDPMGHVHTWKGDELPTLRRIVAGKERSEFGDEIEIIVYRCRHCGHKVEPSWSWESGGSLAHIPGFMVATLTVGTPTGEFSVRLTDAQLDDITNRMRKDPANQQEIIESYAHELLDHHIVSI
jgi:hypothetical protein